MKCAIQNDFYPNLNAHVSTALSLISSIKVPIESLAFVGYDSIEKQIFVDPSS